MFDQALKAIGLVWVLYSAYRLYDALALWILPSVPLTRYQKKGAYESWALVTGASAGIGLGCAQELALRGFNVVLFGHNEDELEDARALIESECLRRHKNDIAVRLMVLDAVKSSAQQVQAAVDGLSDLNVTVLVNNVGGVPAPQPPVRKLRDLSADDVDATIDLNARFMARLTRLLVPILAKNGPSLVLNVSSTTRAGMPGVVMYSATKGFVSSFSHALAREMAAEKAPVDVLCLVAGEVKTQANTLALPSGTPEAREFAKAVMKRAGRAAQRGMLEVTPWFRHAVQRAFFENVPEWLRLKLVNAALEKKRVAHDEKVRKEE
ncbi:very-long-chain 3-oxoacyl-CoA reductase [Colletotrichum spaethianum]|uniref:Very-long-chain 3-oxoacyl-CoA reductase n=1 Tax=Colletotrichum spaethianum TaxID=700344 RepID=A0AA37LE79_9PEZI|nr:very-long-chain 3-oxoacyl-CoA reductase [Colletotrichum spaethianum]GKT44793.1 very-long-chain 3-oxoacyl-CoA reductase [Colletotrichum spaethianum]